MALVIDANVVIATILNEPHRDVLLQLTAGHELISPASLPWEIGNALSAMFKRKSLSLQQAEAAMDLYLRIPIRLLDVDIKKAVRISNERSMYAYDAYMIEASLQSGVELLTLDRRLREAAGIAGVQCIKVTL